MKPVDELQTIATGCGDNWYTVFMSKYQEDSSLMESELLRKLKYKGGQKLIANAPDGYCLGTDSPSPDGKYQFIQVFVANGEDADTQIPNLLASLNEDGVFWVTYPKQSSGIKTDINRDVLVRLVQDRTSYRVVSNVSIDETWSALRIRQKDSVKSRT